MSIWAIADIHASRTDPATGRPAKPMDVFGNQWQDHLERLEAAWQSSVGRVDTIIIAGDTDWALHLHEAAETLWRIDAWNGQKILLRGNHDYWWSSKATNKVRKSLPPSLVLLHNNALQAEGYNICGAKGSPVPGGMDWTEENAKLLNRELQRLTISLEARNPDLPTLAALHYPPFYPSHPESPYREALERHRVTTCVYGHLHGDATRSGPAGVYGGVRYCLVSADAVDFRPVLLVRSGSAFSHNSP
jgi:predicted phosphohydrolase